MFWDEKLERIELGVEIMTGPDIREDEMEKAMRRMKGGKAVGEDYVAIEMLLALDSFSTKKTVVLQMKCTKVVKSVMICANQYF